MWDPVDQRNDLWLIDGQVRRGRPMHLPALLGFPAFYEHEHLWIILGMADIELDAARLCPRQPSLLPEQFAKLRDTLGVFCGQNHVDGVHGRFQTTGRNGWNSRDKISPV